MQESDVTDPASRLIYADWLDEQGSSEEADRQRRRAQLSFVLQQIAAGWYDAELDHIEQVVRARERMQADLVRDARIKVGAPCSVYSQRAKHWVSATIVSIDGDTIVTNARYTYRGVQRSSEITVHRSNLRI